MKHHNITIVIILSILSLTACKSGAEKQEATAPKLKMVDVPAIYSSQQARELYIANHFWDIMDFSDSAYLQDKLAIDVHYSAYINILQEFPLTTAKQSLEKFTTLALGATPALKDYLLEVIENSLYDPNSRLRNEEFYIIVLNNILENDALDPLLKERYREQLQLALKNRVGDIANDFKFTTIEGKQKSLHTLPKNNTLIMFYEPHCPACEASLEYFSNNTVIELASKSFNMIAIYTGDNLEEWKKSAKNFKPYWTVGQDNDMVITMERLYDRRPSPSFYLLDKNRVVILKDALTQEVVLKISTILIPQ